MRDKYDELPSGKKSRVKKKFVALFGNLRTFYNKINGAVKVKPAELDFFEKELGG